MQCTVDRTWNDVQRRLAPLVAQLSKDQRIQIKGVQRAEGIPFRTIETALFESKFSQDSFEGNHRRAGNQIFTINLNNFVN